MFLKQRKKITKNKPVLPDELSHAAYLPDESDLSSNELADDYDASASKRIPVLPPQLSSYLLRSGIAIAGLFILQIISVLSLSFLATKPAPDLVQQDNGVMAVVSQK